VGFSRFAALPEEQISERISRRILSNTDLLPCVIPVGMPKAAELVKSGKVNVFVPTRQASSQYQISCPALEFLTADFPLTGREAGTAYVRKFIENVKAEGLIRSAVEKAGVRGAVEE
jgi:hypothetical protein